MVGKEDGGREKGGSQPEGFPSSLSNRKLAAKLAALIVAA